MPKVKVWTNFILKLLTSLVKRRNCTTFSIILNHRGFSWNNNNTKIHRSNVSKSYFKCKMIRKNNPFKKSWKNDKITNFIKLYLHYSGLCHSMFRYPTISLSLPFECYLHFTMKWKKKRHLNQMMEGTIHTFHHLIQSSMFIVLGSNACSYSIGVSVEMTW